MPSEKLEADPGTSILESVHAYYLSFKLLLDSSGLLWTGVQLVSCSVALEAMG